MSLFDLCTCKGAATGPPLGSRFSVCSGRLSLEYPGGPPTSHTHSFGPTAPNQQFELEDGSLVGDYSWAYASQAANSGWRIPSINIGEWTRSLRCAIGPVVSAILSDFTSVPWFPNSHSHFRTFSLSVGVATAVKTYLAGGWSRFTRGGTSWVQPLQPLALLTYASTVGWDRTADTVPTLDELSDPSTYCDLWLQHQGYDLNALYLNNEFHSVHVRNNWGSQICFDFLPRWTASNDVVFEFVPEVPTTWEWIQTAGQFNNASGGLSHAFGEEFVAPEAEASSASMRLRVPNGHALSPFGPFLSVADLGMTVILELTVSREINGVTDVTKQWYRPSRSWTGADTVGRFTAFRSQQHEQAAANTIDPRFPHEVLIQYIGELAPA